MFEQGRRHTQVRRGFVAGDRTGEEKQRREIRDRKGGSAPNRGIYENKKKLPFSLGELREFIDGAKMDS